MIRWAWRKMRVLSPREYLAIIGTVLLPVLPISLFNLSVGCILLIYAGWCPVAILLIASAHKEQQERSERSIDEKIDEVLGQLQTLREQHDGTTARLTGLEQRVDEVDRVMRTAFEGIGVDLHPRRHEVSAGPVNWGFHLPTAAGTVRSGRWWVRLRRWVMAKAQWVKRWVKRIVWD